VPTQDGLRADQEGGPVWSRQPAAERGQQQAIARLPARAAGLALEDAKLMAEKEYLGLEAGLGAAADEEEIEEQTQQALEQGQEHDLASSQARLLAQISCRSEFLHPTPRLLYAGRVGTGFNQRTLELLQQMLLHRRLEHNPLDEGGPPPGARFVRPELVCDVTFREWTLGGEIRHPSFQWLRPDTSSRRDTQGG
jgi:ATP dependent DNA ligase C terminal region